MPFEIFIYLLAGLGAGIGTGLAGLSAAAVISPMLITFLNMPAYQAVGISLASDVLASAISAYTYGKNKNLDVKNGLIMLASVLVFTMVGSYIASVVPNQMMGGFSVVMTLLLGIKFLIRPVMTTKEQANAKSAKTKAVQSIVCGVVIGFICGFVGAGGGMMLLLILTSVLGYELKTAVGTSVFIMTFTALTGAVSHIAIGGMPDLFALVCCVLFTLLGARIAALFANKAEPAKLNRCGCRHGNHEIFPLTFPANKKGPLAFFYFSVFSRASSFSPVKNIVQVHTATQCPASSIIFTSLTPVVCPICTQRPYAVMLLPCTWCKKCRSACNVTHRLLLESSAPPPATSASV